MKVITGDVIKLALEGFFDVVVHGCNCFCTMKSGISVPMSAHFGCNRFDKERNKYKGDINKLGTIDFKDIILNSGRNLTVVNAYTQYKWTGGLKEGEIPFNYEAFHLCMAKLNHLFKGKIIGMPKIGCGLAKGEWDRVSGIVKSELTDCNAVVVEWDVK